VKGDAWMGFSHGFFSGLVLLVYVDARYLKVQVDKSDQIPPVSLGFFFFLHLGKVR
jgi:hypothetical protein